MTMESDVRRRLPVHVVILILAAASFCYTQVDMMRRISALEEVLEHRPERELYIVNGNVERSDSPLYPAMVIEGKMKIYLTGEYRDLIGTDSSFLLAMTRDGQYEILGYRETDRKSKSQETHGSYVASR